MISQQHDAMSEQHADALYLEALVPAMRKLGVTEAHGVKLGPDPQSDAGPADDKTTQRTSSPFEQEKAARQRDRRILTSGGPRLALEHKL